MIDALLNAGALHNFSLEELEAWGIAFGASLPRPIVITLKGDLGSGKTTLARAICEGLGVANVFGVTSPTFAILQDYSAPNGPVVHADLYRLRGEAELDALGWDEIVDRAQILIVEWPERTTRPWPIGTIGISLSYPDVGLESRVLKVVRM
ncbi:MAG: tRNA (adenosine(37)-N6)-threonylcarbamoyltransferase complex ATPase subunit type 1 TsaE [Gemmatimonadaceae bacterium]